MKKSIGNLFGKAVVIDNLGTGNEVTKNEIYAKTEGDKVSLSIRNDNGHLDDITPKGGGLIEETIKNIPGDYYSITRANLLRLVQMYFSDLQSEERIDIVTIEADVQNILSLSSTGLKIVTQVNEDEIIIKAPIDTMLHIIGWNWDEDEETEHFLGIANIDIPKISEEEFFQKVAEVYANV